MGTCLGNMVDVVTVPNSVLPAMTSQVCFCSMQRYDEESSVQLPLNVVIFLQMHFKCLPRNVCLIYCIDCWNTRLDNNTPSVL